MPRTFFLIIDGMNDLPLKELNYKTPLEVAKTQAMNLLAFRGTYGLIKLFNFAPESDEAMLALLNLDPEKNYPGRGILEAYGAGLPLSKNFIYFRCNLVKVKGERIIDFEARINKNLKNKIEKLIGKIDLGIDFEFKFTKGYRAILVFKNKKFSDRITNTNPVYKLVRKKLSKALPRPKTKVFFVKKSLPLDKTQEAKLTSAKLNEFTEKALKVLKPFNLAILARGASKFGDWFSRLKKIKFFRNWALISEMPVEIAIGKILGMKIYDYEANYSKLIKKIENLLTRFNIYLQIKGPDSFSHRGDWKGKIKAIEKIDKKFLIPLIKSLKGNDINLILTCDHITSSKYLSHVKGNVTFIKINLKDIKKDIKKFEPVSLNFSEAICKKIIKPKDLFNL